jgi:cyclophilin family peptidyl-prolyl cis-trans isomerase
MSSRTNGVRWNSHALRFLPFAVACSSPGVVTPRAPVSDAGVADLAREGAGVLDRIARAEETRHARDLPSEAQTARDPSLRRAYARALAWIVDDAETPLLRALADEDDEVVAWAAYGLGQSCAGREEAHVRALEARLFSLARSPAWTAAADAPRSDDAGAGLSIRGVPTILWALGHCGGDLAGAALIPWLKSSREAAQAAAYGLGEVAARRGSLLSSEAGALLDAAQGSPPLDAALYAFGRTERPESTGLAARLAKVTHEDLARTVAGPLRVFAVRARGRAGDGAAPSDLSLVLTSDEAALPDRVEAVHALARLAKPGQSSLAEAVITLAPRAGRDLVTAGFAVLVVALEALADDVSPNAQAALWTLARLSPPPGASAAILRRASMLRCAASLHLARGAWDSGILSQCDVGDGQAGERARIDALDRRSLGPGGRAVWAELAESPHVRVREAALEIVARHVELADVARAALAAALSAADPGVVATAANVVQGHPDRVFLVEAHDRSGARAPLPNVTPARQTLDPAVAQALRAALARPLRPDWVKTHVALLDAALATGIAEGRGYAETACKDANVTVRARAAKALATFDTQEEVDAGAGCPAPDVRGDFGAERERDAAGIVRVTLDTESGPLAVRFDPRVSPVAVARFVALARAGFYNGGSFHRVVPGVVAEFGDPGGDGYGGSGDLFRSETAPVPFGPLDVGAALAGRDTGSSQLFVTLARSPHLDGQYAWVGRAEGDWNAVAEGDVIHSIRVEP